MRSVSLRTFVQLYAGVSVATASIVYVTDLPEFSSLAPCAASAVSYVVQGLTNTKCPVLVTALESCACTKDQIPAAVATGISSSVLYSCGSTATDDVASASRVFDRYCNQDAVVTSAAPAPTLVSQYITDLPAFASLAPCAASAVSYVVQSLTNRQCPEGPSALASCACSKNQNSLAASGSLNSAVKYSCGSTNTEDITSAQSMFAGYCALGAGVTSFPVGTGLAGSLTYYVTDLPIYSSLAKCAQSAVSYAVQSQTYSHCPAAPAALVSCACVKDQNTLAVSKEIVSDVSYYCGSTAAGDISSALDVFAYYCSAGLGLVTPNGVTASVTVTNSVKQTGTSPRGSGTAATATGTTPAGANSAANSSATSDSNGGGSKTALIGGIAGGVAVVAIGAAVGIWLCIRKRKNNPQLLASNAGVEEKPNGYTEPTGPGELAAIPAQQTSPPPAWSSAGGVSPASTKAWPDSVAYEVAGRNGGPPMHSAYEMQGNSLGPAAHEVAGNQLQNNNPHANAYEMTAYNKQQRANQGHAYEMNGASQYGGPVPQGNLYEMNSATNHGPVYEMGDHDPRR